MLYLNTRSKIDTYTAHRVLHMQLPDDAGNILPMHIPTFSEEEIQCILAMPFADVVSHILNVFFAQNITAWDVSCALGKVPVRVDSIGQKVLIGVLWDNRTHSAEHLITTLYASLCGEISAPAKPTAWARVAISIALLFGFFAELKCQGIEQADVAAAAGDLETVFAAWYARKMGLPVGMILCACNENSNCWDFLHRGSFNAGAPVVNTSLPEMDIQLPKHMESLVYCALGREDAQQFAAAAANGELFSLNDEQLSTLSQGMYVCVVGSSRVPDVISSVSKTDNYALDPYAAAIYGGLQDYRAKTGKNSHTLIWSKHNP